VLEHKSDNISERRKDRGKGPIGIHQRSFELYYFDPHGRLLFPKIGGLPPPPKTLVAIISGIGEATYFKYGSIRTKAH